MASSSDSTLLVVYISHRVEDTGKTFTSHLKSALDKSAIEAIIGDRPDDGEEILETFLNMIPESLISVVILSKNYAGSQRCLDELVKIMECKKENGETHHALPVFVGVEPTHVRKQIEAFGAAFETLIKENQQFKDKENTWRGALVQIAARTGWDSNNTRSEAEMVKRVVDRIEEIINNQPSNNSNDDFVGISRVDSVEFLLCLYLTKDVLSVGIWGMNGIGKTTIAEMVFNRISNQFNGTCFLRGVRKILEKEGLDSLYKNMLEQLSKSCKPLKQFLKSFNSPNLSSPVVQRAFRKNKFLIVFDDVTSFHQLNSFVKPPHFYGPGSRIILTSTDRQVLRNCGCKEEHIYEVEKLEDIEALRLFEGHAFKQQPCTERHKELSKIALRYCKGLPLALKVLGCNLYGKDIREWESELEKLANYPDVEIKDILMNSYEGLGDTEKNIFLDIACIFNYWQRNKVEKILNACNFYATSGIKRLQDKALVTIPDDEPKLRMHYLLEQMGKGIVLHEPGGPSRIWRLEDFYDVMTRNTGTEKVEVISLKLSEDTDMDVMPEAFEKMLRLRVLHLFNTSGRNKVRLPKGLGFLSDKLTYLYWNRYPLASLPDKFLPNNLIELRMQESHIVQLWSGGAEPHFPKLKVMDLSLSIYLIGLPDFSKFPNLERLDLLYCLSLIEMPSSIQHLSKLQCLNLCGCSKFTKLSVLPTNVVILILSGTAIEQLPSWIGSLSQLRELDVSFCPNLDNLPRSIGELKCLQKLDVRGCKSLTSLPESLGNIKSQSNLGLRYPRELEYPDLRDQIGYVLPPMEWVSTEIDLEGFGLVSLKSLNLSKTNLESLPASIKHLIPNLEELSVRDCKNLISLPDLPSSLVRLNAEGCTLLRSLSSSLFRGYPSRLGGFKFIFRNCINLDGDSIMKSMPDAETRIEAIAEWAKSKSPNTYQKWVYYETASAYLCITGSEVPEWFRYREEGYSVKLKLFDQKLEDLSRLAFCCVVSPENDFRLISPSCKCLLVTDKFGPLQFQTSGNKFIPYDTDGLKKGGWKLCFPCYDGGIQSDHVFVWYMDVQHNLQKGGPLLCSEATFEFKAKYVSYERRHILAKNKFKPSVCFPGKIPRCGITPIGRNYESETSWSPLVEDGNPKL